MKIEYKSQLVNFPDFMIVGAGKSGTTSLHHYLSTHPNIFLPSIKETWYLQLRNNLNNEIYDRIPYLPKSLDDYFSLYKGALTTQVLGEATPSYLLFHEETIDSIQELLLDRYKKLKIVIILREPIERLLSLYKFNLLIGTEYLSLEKAILKERERFLSFNESIGFNYIYSTLYAPQVLRYIELFDEVKVLFFDDLKNDIESVIKELTDFLDLDYTPILESGGLRKIHNQTKKNPSITNSVKKYISSTLLYDVLPKTFQCKLSYHRYKEEKFSTLPLNIQLFIKKQFRKDILSIENITGRDLSKWLTKYD